ncbi:MAG TPA: hypothetical protein VKU40_02880 [Thermoanaerobaculia bacterium]|nr:hypothetical protein [Thermoanaerobaculia bacterium]
MSDDKPTGAHRDRSALAELSAPPGLCASCRHLELVGSKRSVFVLCGRAADDPRFLRYPPLPVAACAGYEPEETQ